MTGETSLDILLGSMSPQLNPGRYVFCTLPGPGLLTPVEAIGSFREAEGQTVILSLEDAQRLGLDYDYTAAWITLNIHSALEAVGLTAAFATALGRAGISCNVVAAYYHDHIFVAERDAQRAMQVLQELSQAGTGSV